MYSFPDAQDADSRFGMHIPEQAFLVVGTVSSDMQVNYGSANPRVPAPDIIKTEDSLFSFDSSNERSRTYFGASVTAHEAQSWSHDFSKPPTHDVIEEIILQSRRDKDTIPSDDADLGNDAAEYVPPLTGHAHADNASRMCYSMKPIRSSMHDIAWPLTYMYLVHVILDVLRDMHETCRRIIQGQGSWAALVPSKAAAWNIIRGRGIDKLFWPLFSHPVTGLPVAVPSEA
ncbi:hypothetical protein BKA82DRAFT_4365576 [Pisolithus tinctorius]|nr:hypothetical protein BKA82DRAFT_4365576 [Pisolithus tinctorius]